MEKMQHSDWAGAERIAAQPWRSTELAKLKAGVGAETQTVLQMIDKITDSDFFAKIKDKRDALDEDTQTKILNSGLSIKKVLDNVSIMGPFKQLFKVIKVVTGKTSMDAMIFEHFADFFITMVSMQKLTAKGMTPEAQEKLAKKQTKNIKRLMFATKAVVTVFAPEALPEVNKICETAWVVLEVKDNAVAAANKGEGSPSASAWSQAPDAMSQRSQ